MHSVFASLNWREFWKGFFIALVTAIFLAVKKFFEENNTIPTTWTDWSAILLTSAGVGFAYIGTTFFSNSEGAIMKKEKLL